MALSDPQLVETVRELAERVRALEGRPPAAQETVSSGNPYLDAILPDRGLRRGTLVEWLFSGPGNGAGTLALLAAREACGQGRVLVVVDRQGSFYPPGIIAWGIELRQLLVVRPANDNDDAWAWDQALRSPAVAAVWGWPYPRDQQTLRRWQLAAEASGAIGLLLRPHTVRGDPSWADLRLLVEPIPVRRAPGEASLRRLRVELLRARGTLTGAVIEFELNEETQAILSSTNGHPSPETRLATQSPTPDLQLVDGRGNFHEIASKSRLHLASQLAHPKTRRRSDRA